MKLTPGLIIAFKATLPHTCNFSYHVQPAEQAAVEPGSQDIVTIFEAIHWTDAAAVMQQAARGLKPGSTLAIVHYTSNIQMLDNPVARTLWNEIWYDRLMAAFAPGRDQLPPLRLRWLSQCNSSVNYVALCSGFEAPVSLASRL